MQGGIVFDMFKKRKRILIYTETRETYVVRSFSQKELIRRCTSCGHHLEAITIYLDPDERSSSGVQDLETYRCPICTKAQDKGP